MANISLAMWFVNFIGRWGRNTIFGTVVQIHRGEVDSVNLTNGKKLHEHEAIWSKRGSFEGPNTYCIYILSYIEPKARR